MKLLLDTCTFLWLAMDDPKLSHTARRAVASAGPDLYLSVISACEIAAQYHNERLELDEPPARFVPHHRSALRVQSLPLTEADALGLARLPKLHKDPFDRLLISQAIENSMVLLTPDEKISCYPVKTLW